MLKNILNSYLEDISKLYSTGEAREESFYPCLCSMLMKTWKMFFKDDLEIVIQPSGSLKEKPDIVLRGSNHQLIGYIEAKYPGKDLDKIEETDQLKRYMGAFPNLLLTDFFTFRFYRNGNREMDVTICDRESPAGWKGKMIENPVSLNEDRFFKLFKEFFSFMAPFNPTARELAKALAVRTRFLRDQAVMAELNVKNGESNRVLEFYHAFETYLIHGLTKEEFADIYSQTLTFGLFTAAINNWQDFDRKTAKDFIPTTNGILHDLFEFISMGELSPALSQGIEDIVAALKMIKPYRLAEPDKQAEISNFLYELNRDGKPDKPIIHIYETFLSEYNPGLREKRGVYYTPLPVVNFIVTAVNRFLKEKLGKPLGFADSTVKVLDPAAGTSTFLAETAMLVMEDFSYYYGEGGKESQLRDFITNNLYGFETLMAPYAVGHLNLSIILASMLESPLKKGERFHLYLTDTLDMDEIEQSHLPGMATLSRESRLAGDVKKNVPITVILGNPPYSGHSMNDSEKSVEIPGKFKKKKRVKIKTWIGEQIETYKTIDGKRMREKNLKWLQDDYVKFFRFAQYKIDQNGEGIIGMITNHAYLDNPTFRGMRFSLMESFDEIHILDLHGNMMKKEKSPDGSMDDNVFDIRQGVAIALMVKLKKKLSAGKCRLYHADLWGMRDDKYNFLSSPDAFDKVNWVSFTPGPPFYLFKPVGMCKETETRYRGFVNITDIFPVHSVGIVTARDDLAIKYTMDDVLKTVEDFAGMDEAEARRVFKLGNDTRDWTVSHAQQDIRDNRLNAQRVVPILYRPFDVRYTYYTGKSRGFHCMPRFDVMKNLLTENVALITVRQVAEYEFNHVLVTDTIVDSRITTSNKGIGYVFPLYLYSGNPGEPRRKKLFPSLDGVFSRKPNIHPQLPLLLKEKAGYPVQPTPDKIFNYIYAVLFSNIYRSKFSEYLKMDFPRVPFTSNYELFLEVGRLGERLVGIHLMKSPELQETHCRFDVKGKNEVTRVSYAEDETTGMGSVYINDIQCFSPVAEEVWSYRMGGYGVLVKWLKERRGRDLNHGDIRHFIKIVRAVELTIQYQHQVDSLFPCIEKELAVIELFINN